MNLQEFREILARYLGAQLTPAVCVALEREIMWGPDRSIDPAAFGVHHHAGATIQIESFRQILEELKPLHQEHWLETEGHRHGLQLNPDYEQLAMRERAGRLVQFTVRRGGELAGHLRMFLGPSTHTQTLMAEEDTLFMRPAHRGGFTVVALLRYAERVLTSLGAREIRANSKVVNRADVLMRRLGYRLVAYQFVKVLPAPPETHPVGEPYVS